MAGWTDYADWTNENTIKLVSGNDLLLPLIRAINERLSVMVQYFPYPPVQAIGEDILLCSLDTIKLSIQTAILLMLPYFLNPARISNRLPQEIAYPFDGFAWSHTPVQSHDITYTDILDAINEPEKFNYNEKNTPELWYKWIYQQYLILNKLTVVIRTAFSDMEWTQYQRSGKLDTGWNDDWAQWGSDRVGFYDWYGFSPYLVIPYNMEWNGINKNITRRYIKNITCKVPDIHSFKANINFYAPVSAWANYGYYNELNTQQSQLKQYGEFSLCSTGDELSMPGPFGKIDTIPAVTASAAWGWGVNDPQAVIIAMDFAVEGGFEFKA